MEQAEGHNFYAGDNCYFQALNIVFSSFESIYNHHVTRKRLTRVLAN